jgi:hypothetical protein
MSPNPKRPRRPSARGASLTAAQPVRIEQAVPARSRVGTRGGHSVRADAPLPASILANPDASGADRQADSIAGQAVSPPRWWLWWMWLGGLGERPPRRPRPSRLTRASRRPLWQRLGVLAMILFFLALSQPANADTQVTQIPDNLRQYVAGTPEFVTSPWMTSPTCEQQGGDWSIYTQHVIQDMPALLAFFQPDFGGQDGAGPQRGAEIIKGYKALAAQLTVPGGYCVDTIKQWAGTDTKAQPFQFDWGGQGIHNNGSICTDSVGADNAYCGGFYVSCKGAATQQASQQCQSWDAFSDSYVTGIGAAKEKADADYPGYGQGTVITVPKSPSEIVSGIVNWITEDGMQQVVDFILDGVTNLWASFLQIAIEYTSPDISGAGFAAVYNLVAGIALAVGFLGWIVSLASSWKQGRLAFSLLGGVKAAVGVTLAGVGAILMLDLADQCTDSLALAGGNIGDQHDFTTSLVKANPLIGVIVGILMGLMLLFAIIFLVIHSGLVLMWTLMGSIAAAGQVHPASSDWLRKWASRLMALCWAKFVMVAVMLSAIALELPITNGEDTVQQIVDIVQGLVLAALLFSTPALLWELIDFVGDRVGGSGHSRSTGMAGAGAMKGGQLAGRGLAAGGSAVSSAVGSMMSAAADIGRTMRDGFQEGLHGSGSSGGGGNGMPPRAEDTGDLAGIDQQPNAGQQGQQSSGGGGAVRPPAGPAGTSSSGGGGNGMPPPANRGRVVGKPVARPAPANSPAGSSSGGGTGGSPSGGVPPIPPV